MVTALLGSSFQASHSSNTLRGVCTGGQVGRGQLSTEEASQQREHR